MNRTDFRLKQPPQLGIGPALWDRQHVEGPAKPQYQRGAKTLPEAANIGLNAGGGGGGHIKQQEEDRKTVSRRWKPLEEEKSWGTVAGLLEASDW